MNVADIEASELRQTTDGIAIDPMFTARWSPRAFDGRPLTDEELLTLLEAARWAPSCFNAQPWRFAYALQGSEHWAPLFDTLVEGNQAWTRQAGALIAVIARTEFEHNDRPSPTHAFDAGAAWMSLALQARRMGLFAHGMLGFDQEKLRSALQVPELYATPAVVAVGHPGNVEDLPERYREREKPSSRKPLGEIVFAGTFSALEN
jgi:nitroreductase